MYSFGLGLELGLVLVLGMYTYRAGIVLCTRGCSRSFHSARTDATNPNANPNTVNPSSIRGSMLTNTFQP